MCYRLVKILLAVLLHATLTEAYIINPNFQCGQYGFTCERNNRVRLCDATKLVGPAFVCPPGRFCNEESTQVCDDAINYIDPTLIKSLRCHRNERIANPNVPGCKGYILCVPNGNRYQGINFKCSGNTIFNAFTGSCTSPQKYKCPYGNVTKLDTELFGSDNRKNPFYNDVQNIQITGQPTTIECKNYKFSVTVNDSPDRATYFCPPRPARGETSIRCTIFSNQFCVTLERDEESQFAGETASSIAYRKPRM